MKPANCLNEIVTSRIGDGAIMLAVRISVKQPLNTLLNDYDYLLYHRHKITLVRKRYLTKQRIAVSAIFVDPNTAYQCRHFCRYRYRTTFTVWLFLTPDLTCA